jgi:integrase
MQKGKIELRGNCWLLRYRKPVLVDGKVVMKQTSEKLATYSDQYRTEKSVRPKADEILTPLNAKSDPIQSAQTLKLFIEHVYLPHVRETLKPSTAQTYKVLWRLLEPHTNGDAMADLRTSDIDALLKSVAAKKALAHNTHRKLKRFLSAVWREARRRDLVTNDPVSDAKIPRGKPTAETEAYTLDELAALLKVLPEPGRTAVLVAGLTGLRVSEIKGLRWEDYDGNVLNVRRSVWQGKVSDTKTLTSRAAVPVVAPVREALNSHRKRTPGSGYIFAGGTSNPLRLENTLRREMKPALLKAELEWKGWHGFRRGVGTILNQLGVDAKTIQTILRHANVTTTETFYIKPVGADAVKAMKKLAAAFRKATK